MSKVPTPRRLTGPGFGPPSGDRPEHLFILLHGLGASGADLIALAPLLAEALPKARFIAPDAPEPCDMAPMGRQWFSLGDH
ncbi:MAG: phospholipase, partial [Alphaproteobacteria bacterium]|nr:phospholipase [Alphaproteobacteria bacterium]